MTPEGIAHGAFTYTGIDRADNDIGYTLENSIPICGICNRAKLELGQTQFVTHCTKVAAWCAKIGLVP